MLALGIAAPIATAASAKLIRREMPWQEGAADRPAPVQASADQAGYVFFSPAEAAFVSAAVARLIPADDLGPGALEAGAVTFIDRQLAGDYGRGARWYMQGPWSEGESTQGYQTRHTPASLYRAAIREIDQAVAKEKQVAGFTGLEPAEQDAWLERLEEGKIELATVEPKTFFQLLLQNTLEGYWCDPIHGGNRDMVGWKLIGFAGARYDHRPFVGRHGERYPLPPVGLKGRPEWIKAEK
jgi:gluconate 2-dehydrogenase gamma chain